jgi:hypothetical protein
MKEKFSKSNLDLKEFVNERKISKSNLDLNIFCFVNDNKKMMSENYIKKMMSENYNCKWGWMPMVAMLGLNWKSKPPDSDIRRK